MPRRSRTSRGSADLVRKGLSDCGVYRRVAVRYASTPSRYPARGRISAHGFHAYKFDYCIVAGWIENRLQGVAEVTQHSEIDVEVRVVYRRAFSEERTMEFRFPLMRQGRFVGGVCDEAGFRVERPNKTAQGNRGGG